MSLSNAPWLEGLDGTSTWKPTKPQHISRPSSVTHNAGSLINKQTRLPRRSISGNSIQSIRKARSPLATLNKNEYSRKEDDADSAYNGPIAIRGTVAQRSKSSSPGKKEASLEWRKRLLNGKIGYGDQTDLFGPSGLENIFAGSAKEPRSERPTRSGNLSWMPKSDATMPSSPPPWPSNLRTAGARRMAELKLSSDQPAESVERDQPQKEEDHDSSVVSNPFELDVSERSKSGVANATSLPEDSKQRIISGIDRTVNGPTMLEQEDFSPVILSRHTTVSGTIGYAAVLPPSHGSTDVSSVRHEDSAVRSPQPNKSAFSALASKHLDGSVFTDGPSSTLENRQAHDLSLSENLPTGTPEPLGSYIQVKRGGYSTLGSFRHRPLSAEPSAISHILPQDTSDVLPQAPSPPARRDDQSELPAEQAQTDASSPSRQSEQHDPEQESEWESGASSQAPMAVINARQTSFGDGQLDSHLFKAEVNVETPVVNRTRSDSDGSPASDIAVPGSRIPLTFQTQGAQSTHSSYKRSIRSKPRLPSKAEQTPHPKATLLSKRARVEDISSSPTRSDQAKAQSEHKRVPASPQKTSTPKRRRTLHASELLQEAANKTRDASIALQQASVKTAIKHDEQNQQNSIARPHNPTPSQWLEGPAILPDDIREATDDFLAQEDRSAVEEVLERLEHSLSEADPGTTREQAEEVAAEVARYTIKVSKTAEHDGSGERKKSVTTQDFFREAEFVMEYIRARAAKKPSLLASVEETENMDEQLQPDATLQVPDEQDGEKGYMRVSREPSWADRPRSRWREPEQLRVQRGGFDVNRVASQLRKWKEPDTNEEHDVFLAESASIADEDAEEVFEHSSSEVVYDERAKIRITGPSSEYAQHVIDQPESKHSTQSSSNTTKRTDNVGTLAPDAVAHLIGSEVGGMTFDKDKQRWVRLRSPEHRAVKNGFLDVLESHLTSEDDPFREISDLAVDECVEQRRISSPARLPLSELPQQVNARASSNGTLPTAKQLSISSTVLQHELQPESNIAPSVKTRTGATLTDRITLTPPTSIADMELGPDDDLVTKHIGIPVLTESKVRHIIEDAAASAEVGERLFHADDTRNDGKNTSTSAPGADLLSRLREDTAEDNDPTDLHSSRLRPSAPAALSSTSDQGTMARNPFKDMPRLDADTQARDVSEVSFVAPLPGDRVVSVSLSVSKPSQLVNRQMGRIVEQDSSPLRYQSSLVLSDLPDFTVHQEDPVQTSEKALAKRFAQYAAIEVNDRFAAATKELVKALTDLYPEEPFWQELHDLNMRDQALTTLHGLDSFCDNIRGLDISKNKLAHLHGVPGSVMKLWAVNNQLSSLTSFMHLGNLQYVNVSKNSLESLQGFAGCLHMRELVADDNDIASLDGIAHLDLLKLRCRRNPVQRLEIQQGQWQELTTLDLSGSNIQHLTGLEHLPRLETVVLNGCKHLSKLSLNGDLRLLKHLFLRDCDLSELDVSHLPTLQTLVVDDNALSTIRGLDKLSGLNILSMRRQRLDLGQYIDIFNRSLDARKIYLSGNQISKLLLGSDQLSVKHLELAGVGLTDLPGDFGIRMPNLKSLNLNFNSIKDVRPLLHMRGLQDLQLCGNRLVRQRKTAAVLHKLPALRHVDFRDNPITQGFYAQLSLLPKQPSTALTLKADSDNEQDEDAIQEELDWKLYHMPEQEADKDQKHVDRLDENTGLRRRVYDMLMAYSCPGLQNLDGIVFVRTSAMKKDLVWHRLIELGVVRKASQ